MEICIGDKDKHVFVLVFTQYIHQVLALYTQYFLELSENMTGILPRWDLNPQSSLKKFFIHLKLVVQNML